MDKTTKTLSENPVAGYRQVMRGLAGNHLGCVVISADIDVALKEKLTAACVANGVECKIGPCKAEIGRQLDLDVACAVYAYRKEN